MKTKQKNRSTSKLAKLGKNLLLDASFDQRARDFMSFPEKVFNVAHLLYKRDSFNRRKAQPEMCFSARLCGWFA